LVRRKAVAAMLMAAALVLIAGLLRPRDVPQPAAAVAARPPPRTAAPPALSRMDSVARDERAAASAPGPGEAEVCGLGIVKSAGAMPFGAAQPARALIESARQRLQAAMQSSPDPSVQAAGLLFAAMADGRDAARASDADLLACAPSDGDCQRAVLDAQTLAAGRAGEPAIERLALLAAHSDNPSAYALAMAGCGGVLPPRQRGSGWCRLLGAEQWARLDPDNALPWLAVAGAAHERGDAAGEADAMHHASVAHLADDRTSLLPRLVAELMPGDVPSALRTQAIIDVLGVQAALPYAGYHAAMRYCSAEAARDGNRRQQCAALAALLVERGMTWADAAIGRGIGARAAGWPSERIEDLRDEQRALVEAAGSIVDVEQPLGCASGRRLASWVRLVDEIGEPDAARAWLRRSGSSVDDALRRLRERRAAASAPAGAQN
jgi:hypothetical protein